MKQNPRELLDAAARTRVPDNLNLFPRALAQLERKTFMQTLRAKPALLILSVLLALTLLTGVAYAVGRTLGYIPGVGIVEQGAPIRVLTEPVTVTRDNITLTVTDAILTADKTIVIYTLENVPWSAYSHDENVGGCPGMADLRLPDGEILKIVGGGGTLGKNRFDYPAIPMNVNEATFILPCISGTLPGLAPENWELPLHFKPAPPDMTVVPVVEIDPTVQPIAETAPIQITQAFQIGDDYVIAGIIPRQFAAENQVELRAMRVTDAGGKEVYGHSPSVAGLDQFDWGIQFKAGTVQFPLTLAFDWVNISPLPDAYAELEFNVGKNPQPGQTLELNQPIEIGSRTITLANIQTVTSDSYRFNFTCEQDVTGISAELVGYPSIGSGESAGYGFGRAYVTLTYSQLPTGKLKVAISNLRVASPLQTWSTQWSPDNPPAEKSLYGISLGVDKFIPLDDGYYLIGHTDWKDERITSASPADVKAFDAAGKELMLEAADWQAAGLMPENDNQWIFKIYGKAFAAPISLRATQMTVNFKDPMRLTLDLRNAGFQFDHQHLNMPYKTGLIPLDVPGILAQAFKATYVKHGDQHGFEIAIEADPALQGIGFSIESGQDTTGMYMVGGGGGSNRDETSGLVLSTTLTNAPLTFPIVLRADGAAINGKWETSWTPPAPPAGATPVYAPEACITLEKWKQAAGSPLPIPPGLPQKAMVARGAVSPDPSLFISNLDGSAETPLVFGQGSLSPDGRKLAYSDENDRLMILDIASGGKTDLGAGYSAPRWSPDGKQIAFMRQTDKGFNIFVTDADGQNQRALTDTTETFALGNWTADGTALLIQSGTHIELLSLADASRKILLEANYDSLGWPSAALSPDGKWLAYLEKIPGKIGGGLFLSRLDGSDKRLLVQLEYWPVSMPLFSPDGKWLAFNVMNNELNPLIVPALVNVETCQLIPLTQLNGGEIRGWVNP